LAIAPNILTTGGNLYSQNGGNAVTELWQTLCTKQWIEKVQLFVPNQSMQVDSERISLSSGTTAIETSQYPEYIDGAFVPREPWRKPHRDELFSLCCARFSFLPSSTVGIVTLSSSNLKALKTLVRVKPEPTYGSERLMSHQIEAIKEMLNEDGIAFASKDKSICYGASPHPPKLRTVTRTPNYFVGLHIDSWDKSLLYERSSSSNRVSVNIGEEDRFFLFLNLTLAGMAHYLNINVNPLNMIVPDKVATNFMTKYPDYPIIRVRIRPGEAYIAPTENIIHDASTVDTKNTGWVVNIRGFFGVET
jgi:hypothetical protein